MVKESDFAARHGFADPLSGVGLRDQERGIIDAGWEPERPGTKSLRLLPSGSDRVGDGTVRPTPGAHMGEGRKRRKLHIRLHDRFTGWLVSGPATLRA
jgi:hypothetical protein